jgi:putative membrane protein
MAALFAAALAFWALVASVPAASRWLAILALLLTGKLACLLSVLLIFAPRPLYAAAGGHMAAADLADQQLAGLLMITACPLSYLVAALALAVQMIGGAARRRPEPGPEVAAMPAPAGS